MKKHNQVNAGGLITWFLVVLNAIILRSAYLANSKTYLWLLISVPLLIMTLISGKKENE